MGYNFFLLAVRRRDRGCKKFIANSTLLQSYRFYFELTI